MASVSDSLTGLTVLRDVLQAKLAVYPFEGDSTPKVVSSEEEILEEGVPRIILRIEDDVEAADWGHTARRCTVAATVQASDFAGGIYGVSNPQTADTQLSRFLLESTRDYNAFNDAGLWGIVCTGPREGRSADEAAPGAVNQHRIIYYYDPEDA